MERPARSAAVSVLPKLKVSLVGALPAALVAAVTLTACKNEGAETKATAPAASVSAAATPAPPSDEIDPAQLQAFGPLPEVFESKDNPLTEEKVTLGRALFHEPRLSITKTISCNTCHNVDTFGVDGKPQSEGHNKKLGTRNSPTVYNAAGHFAQFWDGRKPTVEEQATGPILNPVEMGMPDEKNVVAELRLEASPGYVAMFKKAFPGEKDPVSFANVGKAIGAFERRLVTPSRWDKFLKGDKAALTADEKRGFNTFVKTGCTACHNGVLVGGGMFQKLGLLAPWPKTDDQGRYEVTKNDADKMMFKVPSLRNVEKTAPYFHDGSVATLPEAVKLMAKHQLGKELSEGDVTAIVTWLKALTGELPKAYAAPPPLPAGGPKESPGEAKKTKKG